MPDDCPVNDESRRALRNLARRAEWRDRTGAAGAALNARTLQELGREIEAALAREQDRSTWGLGASEQLAAHCRRARPDWSAEQTAELSRLRDEAVTALAPGPGETDEEPAEGRRGRNSGRDGRRADDGGRDRSPVARIASITSRRPVVIALAVVGCVVLIALILAAPHFLSNDSSESPSASASTVVPAEPTTASAPATADTPTTSVPPTDTATGTSSASTGASTASATTGGSSARVTAIQISPEPQQGYPEVIVSGTITTSGTGDVTVTLTVTGSSGQPQVTQIDESGQTSYNLTQTIYLNQWCGQSSVLLTVSSGSVSKSATVPISGC